MYSSQALLLEYFLEQNRCVIQTSLNIKTTQKFAPQKKVEDPVKKEKWETIQKKVHQTYEMQQKLYNEGIYESECYY